MLLEFSPEVYHGIILLAIFLLVEIIQLLLQIKPFSSGLFGCKLWPILWKAPSSWYSWWAIWHRCDSWENFTGSVEMLIPFYCAPINDLIHVSSRWCGGFYHSTNVLSNIYQPIPRAYPIYSFPCCADTIQGRNHGCFFISGMTWW